MALLCKEKYTPIDSNLVHVKVASHTKRCSPLGKCGVYMFGWLPPDVLLHTLSFLGLEQLARLAPAS